MRKTVTIAAMLTLICGTALAQTDSQQGPNNAAVKAVHDNNAAAPVAGANSFTTSQAKSQIEAKGYTHVMHLKKGQDGVWRGTATKDGQSGAVSIDYQGNVN
jgi:hypothetical protein